MISCGNSVNNNTDKTILQKEGYEYGTLNGKVEVNEKENLVYIVVNPDCKCRASYQVEGRYKDDIKKYKGKNILVEGYIKRFSPWSGEIVVEKIIK
jgi:hypothetical protein